MNRSVKEQIRSGLRLGAGAGAFVIAGMLLGSGLRRVVWSVTPVQQPRFADWIGWLEIVLACVLLFVAARVVVLVIGGYGLFGILKSTIVLLTGREVYAPHDPFPRLEAAEIAIFLLVTIVLTAPIGLSADSRPTVLDRVAVTFYVFAFMWHGNRPTFSLDAWPLAGLAGLLISSCVYYWKKRKTATFGRTHHNATLHK